MSEQTKTTYTGPEICAKPAYEVVELLKKKEISPNELLNACEERIKATDGFVNALPILCFDRAHAQLDQLNKLQNSNIENPGWLGGLPLAIKDLNEIARVRTTFGSMGYENFIPTQSDFLVERLEQNGGLIIGKSNTPEMGAGGNTFNEVFGATRNPWDTRKNAGGSSGGAAVSVATGQVWLSHGSDLAGSLRTPAAYCGVVGLRPSPGRVAAGPTNSSFFFESVEGPMARNVRDTALFLDALCGYDPRDPLSIEAPSSSFQKAVIEAESPVRIAYSPDLNGFCDVEDDIDETIRALLGKLNREGTDIEETCPELPGLYETYKTLRAMVWAAGPGQLPSEIQASFKKTLFENIEVGQKLSSEQIFYAQTNRSALYDIMYNFLQKFDVLALPVVPLSPLNVEIEYPKKVGDMVIKDYLDWLRFSFLSTTTGLPSIALPAGFNKDGMPVGIQLIGPPRGEAKLLQVARAIERISGFDKIGAIDPIVRHLD